MMFNTLLKGVLIRFAVLVHGGVTRTITLKLFLCAGCQTGTVVVA